MREGKEMALIKCPECGKEISDKATICPHCSLNIEEYEKHKRDLQEEERKRKEEEERRKQEEEKRKLEEERKSMEHKIKCPECGEIIDKDSVTCPKCAYPIKEEQEKAVEKAAKKKAKFKRTLFILLVAVIVVVLFYAIIKQLDKKEKYNQANSFFNDGRYDDAYTYYNELGDYKDAKSYLKISEIGCQLQEIKSMTEQDYIALDDVKSSYKNVIIESKEYPELIELREDVVEKVYKRALSEDFPIGIMDESLEKKYLLAFLVSDDKDISDIEEIYIDYQSYAYAISKLQNGEYDEAYDLCQNISNNNDEPRKFKDEYTNLYDNCISFLGSWRTEELFGESFTLSFKYSDDEYADENFAEEGSPYLDISIANRSLENESLQGDSGKCYKNLSYKNKKLSFEYHDDGSGKMYHKVKCSKKEDNIVVTIDGKECIPYEPKAPSEDDNKIEPYIGMSSYDAEYNCSWGEPSDKNITETEYGTHEQWVYPGYGYLYIENGKVTTIQK